MKFIVDSLPYYGDICPFENLKICNQSDCPRNWSKYYVCSDKNPHECELLKEENEK